MRLVRVHPPLMISAIVMFALFTVSMAGLVFDDRILTGVPIWLKPLKFSISLAIYTLTLAWLISFLSRGKRVAWWLGTVVAVGAVLEMAVIVGQVLRGRTSHFNFATALDGILFSIMGVTIVMVWLATLWIAILLLIQRIADRPAALAIRTGIIIALGGLATGFLMTSPTPSQLESMKTAQPAVVGAHSVGVADGGPGLPLVNWSTEGGDLRIGHFVGMHALQALPLFALLLVYLSRRVTRLRDEGLRSRLVLIAAGAHGALTVLVTWQALRGQPLTSPDALTLGVAGAIAVGVVGALGLVLARSSRQAVTEAVAA